MKEFLTSTNRIDYIHYIIFNDVKYIREETISLKHYSWESNPKKLLDFHIIKWRNFDENFYNLYGAIEYFSNDIGWAKNGELKKTNPIPEIEKYFKETVGKDLIYFMNISK